MLAKGRSVSLQLLVSATVVISMLILSSVLIFQSYLGQKKNILETTNLTSKLIVDEISLSVKSPIVPAQIALKLLSHDPVTNADSLDSRLDSLPVFTELLKNNSLCKALYIGYNSGEMFSVSWAKDHVGRYGITAPANAVYLLQTKTKADNGRYKDELRFYDESLVFMSMYTIDPKYAIDPRETEWFKKSINTGSVVITQPYKFNSFDDIGITIAERAELAPSVLGISVTIRDFCSLLSSLKITPGSELALFDTQQRVIAYQDINRLITPQGNIASLEELGVPSLNHIYNSHAMRNHLGTYVVDGQEWHGLVSSVAAEGPEGAEHYLTLVIAIPTDELLAGIWSEIYFQIILACGIAFLIIVAGYFLSTRAVQPLRNLAGQVAAIGRFDFSMPLGVKTRIGEVQLLSAAITSMAETISHFLHVSQALNREHNLERMMSTVLQNLLAILKLKQGAIYLYDENNEYLELAINEGNGEYIPRLLLSINDSAGESMEEYLPLEFIKDNITVPLRNRDNILVGLLLIAGSAFEDDEERRPFLKFVENISKSAAIAIETRQLLLAQKNLFKSIIKLIADAIDTKSRHTGGHCKRVPELAIMMLEEAIESNDPAFESFSMTPEEEEEFRIGAWLHDCGKITTPEYVVDKATKLESLYNRIHEIRMRFEVLYRDAEIKRLKAVAQGLNEEEADRLCAEEQARLQEEFAFVAKCNIGGESMEEEDIERLIRIGRRTWTRNFKNSLGLSREELMHKAASGASDITPGEEFLLADKAEHIITWGDLRPPVSVSDERNIWGFNMDLPENMYNYGELYNLSISRGTLTAEERFKINEHIVQTICMLSALPLPRSLRKVPLYAGTHHETIDGKGYPRRKDGHTMSIPEHIMAVADVFEALTAADRPYKDAKSLSQTLQIMSSMVKGERLDQKVFNFFISSKVYLKYAEQYMDPKQIDIDNADFYLVPDKDIKNAYI